MADLRNRPLNLIEAALAQQGWSDFNGVKSADGDVVMIPAAYNIRQTARWKQAFKDARKEVAKVPLDVTSQEIAFACFVDEVRRVAARAIATGNPDQYLVENIVEDLTTLWAISDYFAFYPTNRLPEPGILDSCVLDVDGYAFRTHAVGGRLLVNTLWDYVVDKFAGMERTDAERMRLEAYTEANVPMTAYLTATTSLNK